MTQNLHAAKEALRRSRTALRKGELAAARQWAEKAAVLAPTLEEPWLLLAAVSRPQLSVHYLQRALAINPESTKARKGMAWAHKKLAAKEAAKQALVSPVSQPSCESADEGASDILSLPIKEDKPEPEKTDAVEKPATRRRFLPLSLTMLALVLLAVVIWTLFPHISSFAAELKSEPTATFSQEHWGAGDLSKPTYTPTATATFTPSPTATLTPTSTATPTPEPTETPQPQPTPEPQAPAQTYSDGGAKYVLIDISEQHMYAYEGDTLVFSFVASTGMNNATATGQFSVLNKIPSAYGSTWDIWMPYWLGIYWSGNLQNGIHALPIMSNGATLWDGYLGTPISYGCIVLSTYNASLLYNWVDIGTPVEIRW